jgi:hypothetical protein
MVLAVLVEVLLVSPGCQRAPLQEQAHRDAVPLELDCRVYALLQDQKCDEAARVLEEFPTERRDVQWYMRRGDASICAFRATKSERNRRAIVENFERGMKAFPDSSRLMLEFGVACMAWDDLAAARTWIEKAKTTATRHIQRGVKAYGRDDEAAVKRQAEDLIHIMDGGAPE